MKDQEEEEEEDGDLDDNDFSENEFLYAKYENNYSCPLDETIDELVLLEEVLRNTQLQ